MNNSTPADLFHPLIQKWFREKIGIATDIQEKAWPVIAKNDHILAIAPTGSGKTLTAFLWAINQLATGTWTTGTVRVLYISPLKALNNDIQKNLLGPIHELTDVFREHGEVFPSINVITRSGDTPADERRMMMRRPPEILITTPESLNIILTSLKGNAIFSGLKTVILDEIHTLIGTKRGTHTITAIERLTRISGEFQRIALSATVRPPEIAAEFIGGYKIMGAPPGIQYLKRPVTVVESCIMKNYNVAVRYPLSDPGSDPGSETPAIGRAEDTWLGALISTAKKIIRAHHSTLVFVRSRRTAEKITRLINEHEPEELAYSHHGSLSREVRLAVEEKMKSGELRAIVATGTLELGIDIGSLDQVVLIQAPQEISSAIQRIGRSGHGVGQTSSGIILPLHPRDLIEAAVTARAIPELNIDETRPVISPLDILAQVILSMTVVEEWDCDELYSFIRSAFPYHELPRRHFDLVIDMLSGRYADTRVRELSPRISTDGITNRVRARDGAAYVLNLSGGTIPDRGLYDMRHLETKSKIGELDEEFVWERSIGDTFTFGTQVWRIDSITHNDVLVLPVKNGQGMFPFWRAEPQNRGYHYSRAIGEFLECALRIMNDESFIPLLRERYRMDEESAISLNELLHRQREACGSLPHAHNILVEHFSDPGNRQDTKQVVLHTMWGGRINRPLAFALSAAWEERYGLPLETFADNDAILLMLPHELGPREILDLVTPDNAEKLIRKKLESTGYFGARFRENAGRALLLPRAGFKKRLPLWLNRLRSKKLMEAVLSYDDFPILIETWRTCLADDFDIGRLIMLLDAVREGTITISECRTQSPSPFASGLVWQQTNKHMYEDDSPTPDVRSNIRGDLIKEITSSSHLRPRIPEAVILELEGKLKRTAEGYSPGSPHEIVDWVKDRVLIPDYEWKEFLSSLRRDHGINLKKAVRGNDDDWSHVFSRIAAIRLPGAKLTCVCAIEAIPHLTAALGCIPESPAQEPPKSPRGGLEEVFLSPPRGDLGGSSQELIINHAVTVLAQSISIAHIFPGTPEGQSLVLMSLKESLRSRNNTGLLEEKDAGDIIAQFLSFYGPVTRDFIAEVFGISRADLVSYIDALTESETIIEDLLREGSDIEELCDFENFEILLRMTRRQRRPAFSPLKIESLQLFLATYQGLTHKQPDMAALPVIIDQLFGYPADPLMWERFIFPARLDPYYTAWLDSLMQSSKLIWFGCGKKKISFTFDEDLDLFIEPAGDDAGDDVELRTKAISIFPHERGRYEFTDLLAHTGLVSAELTELIWNMTWEGTVTNDSFDTVRKGAMGDFKPYEPDPNMMSRGWRNDYHRWYYSQPHSGPWRLLPRPLEIHDPVAQEELKKERVRQLMRRYGILFRELIERELPLLRWSSIFRTLRIMELSGEIYSGYFFENIPGLQFISSGALRMLQDPLDTDAIYWLNAADPASLCGINIKELKQNFPSRLTSTWLVCHGAKIAMLVKKNGKAIMIHASPHSPVIQEYLKIYTALFSRNFNPEGHLFVESINGIAAANSEYAADFKNFGFKPYYKSLSITKNYR